MCYDIFCDCLYKLRCCLFKLLIPLWLLDLALSGYFVYELFTGSTVACCTDNLVDRCSNDDIAKEYGTSNVEIDNNGYCVSLQPLPQTNCGLTLQQCAINNGFTSQQITDLCSADARNKIAINIHVWLIVMMCIKMVGIVFLIGLEFRGCCKNKEEPEKADEQDAQDSNNCCDKCANKCEKAGKECLCTAFIFVLKIVFLLFGTVVTFMALWYLRLTGNVARGSCRFLEGSLKEDCLALESSACTNSQNDNFYNILFLGLDLKGPAWVNMALNVVNTVVWFVRLAVMRYFINKTHIVEV